MNSDVVVLTDKGLDRHTDRQVVKEDELLLNFEKISEYTEGLLERSQRIIFTTTDSKE